eukprot:12895694-Prorocentrum_lima.AAC.1
MTTHTPRTCTWGCQQGPGSAGVDAAGIPSPSWVARSGAIYGPKGSCLRQSVRTVTVLTKGQP